MLTDNLPTTSTPQNELPSVSQSNSAISSTQSSTPSILDSPIFSLDSVVASPTNPTSSFLEEAQPLISHNHLRETLCQLLIAHFIHLHPQIAMTIMFHPITLLLLLKQVSLIHIGLNHFIRGHRLQFVELSLL